MTKHVETLEHLFEEAMRPTEEVGNYMVLENYWEEPQQHPLVPTKYGICIFMELNVGMVLEQEMSLYPPLEKRSIFLSVLSLKPQITWLSMRF